MQVALRPLARAASQAGHIAHLATLDPGCPHRVVDDPSAADAILVTDALAGYETARGLLSDEWIRRYPDKAFVFCQEARPFRPLPGLYTSYPRRRGDHEIARAVGYPCWFLNPWIDEEASAPPSRDPDLLYSFLGRRSHPVRKRLLEVRHPADTRVVDTTRRYVHMTGTEEERREHEQSYVEIAVRSKFALCPRGWATSTIRLYEMMALGVAPVVLADHWVPPFGPEWERFAIFVPEDAVASLPGLLREREAEWSARGAAAIEAYRSYFAPSRHFRTMMDALADLLREPRGPGRALRRAWPITLPAMVTRQAFRSVVRRFA